MRCACICLCVLSQIMPIHCIKMKIFPKYHKPRWLIRGRSHCYKTTWKMASNPCTAGCLYHRLIYIDMSMLLFFFASIPLCNFFACKFVWLCRRRHRRRRRWFYELILYKWFGSWRFTIEEFTKIHEYLWEYMCRCRMFKFIWVCNTVNMEHVVAFIMANM